MFKDYYKILSINYPATQQEIRTAYITQTKRWHPDRNPNIDTTKKMQDINEAYQILSNVSSKERYDREYSIFKKEQYSQKQNNNNYNYDYDVKDEDLKDDIFNARKTAEEYVKEFFSTLHSTSKSAIKGSFTYMFYVILGFIGFGIFAFLVSLLAQQCH